VLVDNGDLTSDDVFTAFHLLNQIKVLIVAYLWSNRGLSLIKQERHRTWHWLASGQLAVKD